jgi:hypothetical protein
MRIRKIWLLIVTSLLTVLITGLFSIVFAQEKVEFPLPGVVINPHPEETPGGIVLTIREAPPEVTAGNYQLAALKCKVRTGTKFEIKNAVEVVSIGEIWYEITINNPNEIVKYDNDKYPSCPSTKFDGWIIGRFSTGTKVVEVIKPNEPKPSEETQVEPEISPEVTNDGQGKEALRRQTMLSYFASFSGAVIMVICRKLFEVSNTKALLESLLSVIFWLRAFALGLIAIVVAFLLVSTFPSTVVEYSFKTDWLDDLVKLGRNLLTGNNVLGFWFYGALTSFVIHGFLSPANSSDA